MGDGGRWDVSWSPRGSQVIEITHCVASLEIEKKIFNFLHSRSKPKMTSSSLENVHFYKFENQSFIMSRYVFVHHKNGIIFIVVKFWIVVSSTYGVKNFWMKKGVKNFWFPSSFLPKSIMILTLNIILMVTIS